MRIQINYKTFMITEKDLEDLNTLLHRESVSVVDKQGRDGKWKPITTGKDNPLLRINQSAEWEGSED